MPFQTIPSITPSPSATVYLHGLLVVSRNANGGCDVGIHRSAPPHDLRIDIILEKPFPFPMKHLEGHLQVRNFNIDVQNASGQGVRKYEATGGFDRSTSNNLEDFRWAVNLGSPEFHNLPLTSVPADTRPAVVINEGILYSAQLTDEDHVSIWRRDGGKDPLNLHRIASFIGINLYDDVLLSWHNPGGRDESRALSRIPGLRYSIVVNNDPPQGTPVAHDELIDYYRVLRKNAVSIPSGEQFKLEVTPLIDSIRDFPKLSKVGSDRIPCMPAVIDG